jgi:hypothetical protein
MEINVNCPKHYQHECKVLRARLKLPILLSVCTNDAHKSCLNAEL